MQALLEEEWRQSMSPQRVQRKRTKDPRPTSVNRPCYGIGCENRAKHGQNGYCGAECRFWSKVTKTEGCWMWDGANHSHKGYGRIDVAGTRWIVHRFSYTLAKGDIPEGYEVDHLCHNTRCVNPEHLEAITPEEHAERTEQGAYNAARTHCPHGHEYTASNTRVSQGHRHCRSCGANRYLELAA